MEKALVGTLEIVRKKRRTWRLMNNPSSYDKFSCCPPNISLLPLPLQHTSKELPKVPPSLSIKLRIQDFSVMQSFLCHRQNERHVVSASQQFSEILLQAYLRYVAGSIPDYFNKANITIKRVTVFLLVEDPAFIL